MLYLTWYIDSLSTTQQIVECFSDEIEQYFAMILPSISYDL